MNQSTDAAVQAEDSERKLSPSLAYHHYLGPAMFAPWARILLDIAEPDDGERVLDLACGTGIVTSRLASRLGRGRVTGVDLSEDMLAVARDLPLPGEVEVRWLCNDACALDLDDGSFDLVLCQQGFQFFPDKPAAAREMRRLLARPGRAVVAVWQGLDQHPVFRALMEAEARHLDVSLDQLATPFSFGDGRALAGILRKAGFDRVDVGAHSLVAAFPDPERFIELVVMAGAAVIPELDLDSPQAHTDLLASVKHDAEAVVARHRHNDTLRFPMHANIAVAVTC